MNETELVLYCDFHGHSRKQNVFVYGCENKHLPNEKLKERIFPAMLSRNDPSKVRIKFLFQFIKNVLRVLFILLIKEMSSDEDHCFH